MIIVELTGGLGNQIFQYAVGRRLSVERGVGLLFDTRYFATDATRWYSLKHFEVVGRAATRIELKLLCSNAAGRIAGNPLYHPTLSESPHGFDPAVLRAGSRTRLTGYFSLNEYFEDTIPALRADFVLRNSARTDAWRSVADEVNVAGDSVAVHIRRGDYVSNQRNASFFEELGAEYYRRAIDVMSRRLSDPAYFVFSDDPGWATDCDLFPAGSRVRVVSVPEGLADYLEFDLMRRCRNHIVANSTFSWWAAALSDNPQKITIQPAIWYRDERAQRIYEDGGMLFLKDAIRV